MIIWLRMKTPYGKLNRDNQFLHGFDSEDLDDFIDLAQLGDEMEILDGMCGNGTLSERIIKNQHNVNLYLLDNSNFQINLAKEKIDGAKFFVSTILETPFVDKKFDRVLIRNGIYEISRDKKDVLYREIYRILKDGGQFLFWAPKLNDDNQKMFQDIIRKKDALAGFDYLAENRYLATANETHKNLTEAQFQNINFSSIDINYSLSTKKWCEVDFKKDKGKLLDLNDYIRGIQKEVPGIEIKDNGDDIQITVPALTAVAQK